MILLKSFSHAHQLIRLLNNLNVVSETIFVQIHN